MIVIGNQEFVTGMRFAGVKLCFAVKKREDVLQVIEQHGKDQFMLVNASVLEMVPELKDLENVVSLPDNAENFGNIDDLKHIIKSVVGIELEVV